MQAVYASEVLDSLTKVSRKLIEQPEVIELDETYLKNAGRVASVRAAQAATRLQAVIRLGLKAEAGSLFSSGNPIRTRLIVVRPEFLYHYLKTCDGSPESPQGNGKTRSRWAILDR